MRRVLVPGPLRGGRVTCSLTYQSKAQGARPAAGATQGRTSAYGVSLRCFASTAASTEEEPPSSWWQAAPRTPAAQAAASSDLQAYLARILNARVYELAIETPLQPARNMSHVLKNNILLKREDLQPVFSFKLRGAYNKIVSSTPEQLARGVVACSAGNHAQGVALSASRNNIRAVIVMPLATPQIKVDAVRSFGGPTVTVKLHGKNYDEASEEAYRLSKEDGLTMVHPFDDPDVIAGQGTIAMEILKATNGRPLDAVFVCVGGGGLIAGVAACIKAVRPSVKVIGVEAEDAAGMTESLRAGHVVTLDHVGLFADGAAVRVVGKETFRLCKDLVDGMVTVTTDEICAGIKAGFKDTRSVMEPAGALAIAGAKKYLQMHKLEGKTIVAIASGANMDFDRLRFVSERSDSTESLLAVRIGEKPGSFRQLYSVIFPRNVTEFSYRFNNPETADVIISYQSMVGTVRDEDKKQVLKAISSLGLEVVDLSTNEMAKAHARYLAGGRAPHVKHEQLFRFEFPERPGALHSFLTELSQGWNVSLFHYRNQGGDMGRVLVGLQVEAKDEEAFKQFLKNLEAHGYIFHNESGNSVYHKFLYGGPR